MTRGDKTVAPLVHPPVVWQVELDDPLLGEHEGNRGSLGRGSGCIRLGHFPPAIAGRSGTDDFRDDIRQLCERRSGDGWPPWLRAIVRQFGHSTRAADRRPTIASISSPAMTGSLLNDLVSYNNKHNEANGEGNRDGIDNNLSWNCGVGGSPPAIRRSEANSVRGRSATSRAILLLSRGVPMLLAGDEFRRTQRRQQ